MTALVMIVAMSCLVCSQAAAQANTHVERATQLFDEAQSLMKLEEWAAACRRLESSQELDPQLGTQLHLAHCYEKQGKLASAWSTFMAAHAIAKDRNRTGSGSGEREPREEVAARRAKLLEPRLSTITISLADVATVGLSVQLDGRPLESSRWGQPVPIDPGEHRVRVAAPGRPHFDTAVEVRGERARAVVRVPALTAGEARPLEARAAPTASLRDEPDRDEGHVDVLQLSGLLASGVGIIGLAIGVGFAFDVDAKREERSELCPNEVCETEDDAQRIAELNKIVSTGAARANVSFIAGGVVLAAGLGLLLFAPDSDPVPEVAVDPQTRSATLGVRWRIF